MNSGTLNWAMERLWTVSSKRRGLSDNGIPLISMQSVFHLFLPYRINFYFSRMACNISNIWLIYWHFIQLWAKGNLTNSDFTQIGIFFSPMHKACGEVGETVARWCHWGKAGDFWLSPLPSHKHILTPGGPNSARMAAVSTSNDMCSEVGRSGERKLKMSMPVQAVYFLNAFPRLSSTYTRLYSLWP